MKYFVAILIGLSLCSCKRYYAINMMGDNNIDVTYLVKKKKFIPYYNQAGEILSLKDPNPKKLDGEDILTIKDFLSKKGLTINKSDSFIQRDITYFTSYFITYSLVDVYRLTVSDLQNQIYSVEIRKENEELILPPVNDTSERFIKGYFSDSSW